MGSLIGKIFEFVVYAFDKDIDRRVYSSFCVSADI
jgi:hypothetical protein